jgi:hypothetical protein
MKLRAAMNIRWDILDPRLRGDDPPNYRVSFPQKRGSNICCSAENPDLLADFPYEPLTEMTKG